MAIKPCAHCGHRFLGPASRAYIAIMDGVERWEHKPPLCAPCYGAVRRQFDDVGGEIDYGSTGQHEPQPCIVCHGETNGRFPQSIFMTGYPAHGARTDYFAPVCQACRPTAEVMLKGR